MGRKWLVGLMGVLFGVVLVGGGQFPAGQSFGTGTSRGVALGDLDGDTDLDAFVANSGGNTVWLNDGGVLSDSGQSLGTSNGYDVALGDVDGDDDLDGLVANNTPDPGRVWVNDGSGTFSSDQGIGGDTTAYLLAPADLDGDLDPDLFAANFGANTVWLNGVPGVPDAIFDVSRETNEAGDEVTCWATSGDVLLPVMLSQPARSRWTCTSASKRIRA